MDSYEALRERKAAVATIGAGGASGSGVPEPVSERIQGLPQILGRVLDAVGAAAAMAGEAARAGEAVRAARRLQAAVLRQLFRGAGRLRGAVRAFGVLLQVDRREAAAATIQSAWMESRFRRAEAALLRGADGMDERTYALKVCEGCII